MSYRARWDGTCGGCGAPFQSGTILFNSDEHSDALAITCCGELDDSYEGAKMRPELAQAVMPRGMSIKDKCPRCFQIPSSNKTCGCD